MSLHDFLFSGLGAPLHGLYQEQTIVHYPGGVRSAAVEVTALVDLSGLLGTNEITGDGAITQDDHGDRERRTGHIEVPKSLVVTRNDTWHIDGELWTTQRQDGTDIGPDGAYQGWRVTLIDPRRSQRPLLNDTRQRRNR